MRRIPFPAVATLLIAALLAGATGCAFEGAMRIRGVVVDPDNEPIPGAEIKLESGGTEVVTVANELGCFELVAVAPGSYSFLFEGNADGYKHYRDRLRANRENPVVIRLAPVGDSGGGKHRKAKRKKAKIPALQACLGG